jgi:WhiB family redox-sensing transcriptional regulator
MTQQSTETRRPMRYAATSTNWRTRAACRGVDPDVFFPKIPTAQARSKAQAFCDRCPVRVECLGLAEEIGATTGVWGGVDQDEAAARKQVKRSYGSSHLSVVLDIIVNQLAEFKAAVDAGMTAHEVARKFQTNAQTVHNVIAALEKGEVGWERDTPDEEVVRQYLAGEVNEVHPRERLAAIVQGVRSGMTYVAFDQLHQLPRQSTETFVRKARKLFQAAGVDFPDMGRPSTPGALSDAQVVELRELRASGVLARDLAARFGLSPGSVRDAASGRTYRHLGGPLTGKGPEPHVVEFEGGQDRMEAAA